MCSPEAAPEEGSAFLRRATGVCQQGRSVSKADTVDLSLTVYFFCHIYLALCKPIRCRFFDHLFCQIEPQSVISRACLVSNRVVEILKALFSFESASCLFLNQFETKILYVISVSKLAIFAKPFTKLL